ncbi:MAG: 2-hydroxyacid dehydrogenase [Mariprofundaceae bacterium]|nr:2-hydroxyacid dehydrogenase [Mariprofundaceae bacterium]
MMKITVFSAKPYDKKYFIAENTTLGHHLVFHEARLQPSTVELARGSDAVCVFVHDDVSALTIESLKSIDVQVIALRCAGYNNVDLAIADAIAMPVVRVEAYSPYAVAEHTVALMLSLNRRIHRAYHRVRDGNFSLQGLTGFDMHGRTVGIVGAGRIGSIVAGIMQGFGCRVLLHDAYEDPLLTERGMTYVPLDELLKEADIITLHCPLTPDTFHLINEETFTMMKDGVMIVNTSRGAIVDAHAAIEGLKSGKIGYLGLDVYEQEGDLFFRDLSETVIKDDVFERLLTFPNVLVTGHQGYFTDEALSNIAQTTLANLAAYEKTGELQHVLHCDKAIAG